jgi:hypothetical protein
MNNPIVLPKPGDRIGSVTGPGQFPSDNPGTVVCISSNRFGSFAVVQMDSGIVEYCHGMNRGPGIGWHPLKKAGVKQ